MAIRCELQVVGEKKEKHVYVLRKDKVAPIPYSDIFARR